MSKKDLLKTMYQELAKKYSLPSLEQIDHEIEMVDYLAERKELPTHLLRATRRRFVDIVGGWISYLHNFLHPNQQSMILVHEASNITQEEKTDIMVLINQLMFMNRIAAQLELERDEQKEAEFLQTYFPKWLEMKERMLIITRKNVAIWQQAMEKKVEQQKQEHYFG